MKRKTIEYINAPINTTPKARRVLGAQAPFGGSRLDLLGFWGVGWSAYPRRYCEIGIKRWAAQALYLDKHRKADLTVDIMGGSGRCAEAADEARPT